MDDFRGGRALSALLLALTLLAPSRAKAFESYADDAATAVTLPAGTLGTEAIGIRKVLDAYIKAVEAKDGKATVKVSRRDTINGSIVSSFPQTFQLAKEAAGWQIEDIGR